MTTKEEQVGIDIPDLPTSKYSNSSTHNQSSVTQEQVEDNIGTELSRTSTLQSVQKKMTDILDNPIFAGFLLILAGIAIAFQAGKSNILQLRKIYSKICTIGCNATLNRYGGRAFSSVISFGVGVACCLIFFAFDVTVGKTPPPNDYVKCKSYWNQA